MEKEPNQYGTDSPDINITDYTAFSLTAAILEAGKIVVLGEESPDLITALEDGAELIASALDVLAQRRAKNRTVAAFSAIDEAAQLSVERKRYNDFVNEVGHALAHNLPIPIFAPSKEGK